MVWLKAAADSPHRTTPMVTMRITDLPLDILWCYSAPFCQENQVN
jgi:hypothetical protein